MLIVASSEASITGTMFRVKVDRDEPTDLHEQVAGEIRRAIAEGEAKPGERLPPARDLAAELGVNRNTVLRALRQLRDEGLLEFRRGRGNPQPRRRSRAGARARASRAQARLSLGGARPDHRERGVKRVSGRHSCRALPQASCRNDVEFASPYGAFATSTRRLSRET